MHPDRVVADAKVGRDRPVKMATRYITRDEATAAALVIGAAFGVAGIVVLTLIASSSQPAPNGPRSAVVVTTQEVD